MNEYMIMHDDQDDDVTDEQMAAFADHLETYLDFYTNIFIIPDHLIKSAKTIDEAILTVKGLIKKLRKGDRKVFKKY